jgi:hypothetical protein
MIIVKLCIVAAASAFAISGHLAGAQSLPAASRTVYKCDDGDRIVYSDTPCLGAKRIEVEPTRGFSRSSGQEKVGADVQREKTNEAFAEGLRPLTGMDSKQLQAAGRRNQLPPGSRSECQRLDTQIPALERQEATVTGNDLAQTRTLLLQKRRRFRELGC